MAEKTESTFEARAGSRLLFHTSMILVHSVDFEMTTAHGIVRPSNLTLSSLGGLPQGGE